MSSKLTKKLQVLLSEEEVFIINRIILNEAIENGERPVSVSAFIRDLIRQEINKKSDLQKSWDRNRIKQLKSK
jgi:hypothetical protein|tara:strand:+ start:1216 stop:1434 length:219 start_codon:yes stop_codon:yes gene_type:complete